MLHFVLLSVSSAAAAAFGPTADKFVLPKEFIGVWRGVPTASILGPWLNNLTMSVGATADGDFEIKQHITAYKNVSIGHQRFSIEGSGPTAGTLWYCGVLLAGDFFPYDAVAWDRFVATTRPVATDTQITFCLDYPDNPWPPGRDPLPFPTQPAPVANGCTGCSCAQWTLKVSRGLDGEDTLTSSLNMGGSYHLLVNLRKLRDVTPGTPAPLNGHGAKFSCNYSNFPDPRGTAASGNRNLQYKQQTGVGHTEVGHTAKANCPFSVIRPATTPKATLHTQRHSRYPNCYTLNYAAGVQLEWQVDHQTDELTVAISADTGTVGKFAHF
jgi:hypothetical protein